MCFEAAIGSRSKVDAPLIVGEGGRRWDVLKLRAFEKGASKSSAGVCENFTNGCNPHKF